MSDAPGDEGLADDAPAMVFAEPKRRRRGGWIIVVAAIALAVGAAVLVIVQLQRPVGQPDADPTRSPSPSPATTTSPTPTGVPSPTSTSTPSSTPATPVPTPTSDVEETTAPVQTDAPSVEPPVVEPPSAEAFSAAVGPRLDDALTGVRMLGKLSGPDAVTVVDQLTQDAMVLSDTIAPSTVGQAWVDATAGYIAKLRTLRGLYAKAGDAKAALAEVQQGAEALRALAGL